LPQWGSRNTLNLQISPQSNVAKRKRRTGAASALRQLIPGIDKSINYFWPKLQPSVSFT
jgi:hypothetical protein